MQTLEIQSSHELGQYLLRVAGFVDLSDHHRFATALEHACTDESVRDVALDLRRIDFIGSHGVSSILKTHGHLRSRHRRLKVIGCSAPAARILTLMGVDFLLRDSLPDGLNEEARNSNGLPPFLSWFPR